MFRIVPAMHSHYPRIGDEGEQQRLRRAIARWERGEITDADLRAVENDVTREILQEQKAAGLEVLTDGQIRWYCPLSYFARALDGVSVGGLLRWFDTNFYCRRPVAEGPIRWRAPVTAEDFRFARTHADRALKVVLPGPYTLAVFTVPKGEPYASRPGRLILDWAQALASEIEALASAGADWIQVEEPSLLQTRRLGKRCARPGPSWRPRNGTRAWPWRCIGGIPRPSGTACRNGPPTPCSSTSSTGRG